MAWRTSTAVIFFLVPLLAAFGQARPIWPRQFDVAFGLSTLANIVENNPPLVNKTAHFYYNWNLKAQRIDYPEACVPIFPVRNDNNFFE